ncbi:hypothetical protein AB0F17_61910 [Nonomuraea sp. NPDC026600]|uniref:hypothetical protein n=1 Tax=Nonomuraea sp. NPDC026600 TaxID=3155363 RepID=UPI0033F6254E
MGTSFLTEGRIRITPPLPYTATNPLIHDAPPGAPAADLFFATCAEDGYRGLGAIVAAQYPSRFGDLAGQLQTIIDRYPGHTFHGLITYTGDDPNDVVTITAGDGKAVFTGDPTFPDGPADPGDYLRWPPEWRTTEEPPPPDADSGEPGGGRPALWLDERTVALAVAGFVTGDPAMAAAVVRLLPILKALIGAVTIDDAMRQALLRLADSDHIDDIAHLIAATARATAQTQQTAGRSRRFEGTDPGGWPITTLVIPHGRGCIIRKTFEGGELGPVWNYSTCQWNYNWDPSQFGSSYVRPEAEAASMARHLAGLDDEPTAGRDHDDVGDPYAALVTRYTIHQRSPSVEDYVASRDTVHVERHRPVSIVRGEDGYEVRVPDDEWVVVHGGRADTMWDEKLGDWDTIDGGGMERFVTGKKAALNIVHRILGLGHRANSPN